MKPTPLDRAADVVLAGICRELPGITPDQLDALLARVSLLHRRRRTKASEEEIARRASPLLERLNAHLEQAPRKPARRTRRRTQIAERDALIRARRAAGEHVEDLAAEFDITPQRVYQIIGPTRRRSGAVEAEAAA